MSKLAHSNQETMDLIELKARYEDGDVEKCKDCHRYVDLSGWSIDPRGACFYCKAD